MASGTISQSFSRATYATTGRFYTGAGGGNWAGSKPSWWSSYTYNYTLAAFLRLGTQYQDSESPITGAHASSYMVFSNTDAGEYSFRFKYNGATNFGSWYKESIIDVPFQSRYGYPNIAQNDWFALMYSVNTQPSEPVVRCWVHKVGEADGWNLARDYIHPGHLGPIYLNDASTMRLVAGALMQADDLDLSQFYMTNEFVDWDDINERNRFVNRQGRPVYLGDSGELLTGTQPKLYFSDGYGINNKGSEPDFLYEYDIPPVSSSSPSDGGSTHPFLYQQGIAKYSDNAGPLVQTLPSLNQAGTGAFDIVDYKYGPITHGFYYPRYQTVGTSLHVGHIELYEESTDLATTSLWTGTSEVYTTCIALRSVPPAIPGRLYGAGGGTAHIWYQLPGFLGIFDMDRQWLFFDTLLHPRAGGAGAVVTLQKLEYYGIYPGDWFALMMSFDGRTTGVVEQIWVQKIGDPVAYDMVATAIQYDVPATGPFNMDFDRYADVSVPQVERTDIDAHLDYAHLYSNDNAFTDFSKPKNRFRYLDVNGYLQDLGATGTGFDGSTPRIWCPDGDLTDNQGTISSFVHDVATLSTTDSDTSPTDNGPVLPMLNSSATGTAFYNVEGTIDQGFGEEGFSLQGLRINSLSSDEHYLHTPASTSTYGFSFAGFFRVPTNFSADQLLFSDTGTAAIPNMQISLYWWQGTVNGLRVKMGMNSDYQWNCQWSGSQSYHGISSGDWFAMMLGFSTSGSPRIHRIWFHKVGGTEADLVADGISHSGFTSWPMRFKGESLGGDLWDNSVENRGNLEYAGVYCDRTYIDWNIEANRRKFVQANGCPAEITQANLSSLSGVAPMYYFPNGDPTVNWGNWGTMTAQNGGGSVSGTSPSDSCTTSIHPLVQAAEGLFNEDGVFHGPLPQTISFVTQALTGTNTVGPKTGVITQDLGFYRIASPQYIPIDQVLAGTVIDPIFSGPIAQTLPILTSVASGVYWGGYRTAVIAQEPPAFTSDLTGTFEPVSTGALEQAIAVFTQNLLGTWDPELKQGAITQALPNISQAGTSVYTPKGVSALIDQTVPFLSQTLAGKLPTGLLGQAVAVPTQDLSGIFEAGTSTANMSQTLPMLDQSLIGRLEIAGTITQELEAPVQALSSYNKFATNIGFLNQSMSNVDTALTGVFEAGTSTGAITQSLWPISQSLRGIHDIAGEALGLIWEQPDEELIWEVIPDELIWCSKPRWEG